MIVFKVHVNRIGPDGVVLTLEADGDPIGQLVLSPRMCRALVSQLFDDDQKGDEHVILEQQDRDDDP